VSVRIRQGSLAALTELEGTVPSIGDFVRKPVFDVDFIANRQMWKHDGLLNKDWHTDGPMPVAENRRVVTDPEEATLVGSRSIYDDSEHEPVLDIDFPAALVPSTTEGHFHLYLNRTMSWDDYQKLLTTLYEVGIIEEGFYKMSLMRGQTFVRMPGVKKKPGEAGSAK
jgi:hypothetical protein